MSNAREFMGRNIARMFKNADVVNLGAGMVVDEKGNLAGELSTDKRRPCEEKEIMKLLAGAEKVVIAMEHTTKEGLPKILSRCAQPLMASERVSFIVTELGVMEVTPQGLVLNSLAPGVSIDEIQSKTEAELLIPEVIATMI